MRISFFALTRDMVRTGGSALDDALRGGGVPVVRLDLTKWTGRCKDSLRELGYASVDKFIDHVRGQ